MINQAILLSIKVFQMILWILTEISIFSFVFLFGRREEGLTYETEWREGVGIMCEIHNEYILMYQEM